MNYPDHPPEPPWLPPPDPPPCLVRAYSSNPLQKGGTLIAEDVLDREAHGRRLRDPDGYRPKACMHCGGTVLHVHDYLERVACGDACSVTIVRYRCAADGCGATHRVLPAFLPRHLWYSWRSVEDSTLQLASDDAASVECTKAGPPPRPPALRTILRWLGRLGTAARVLLQLFASVGTAALTAMVAPLGLDATRGQLVVAYDATMDIPPGRQLSALAGHVHRIVPGLRLM